VVVSVFIIIRQIMTSYINGSGSHNYSYSPVIAAFSILKCRQKKVFCAIKNNSQSAPAYMYEAINAMTEFKTPRKK